MINFQPDESESDLGFPMKGDCLFLESEWKYDAQVVADPGERFYRLPMGYKRAGDVLVLQAEVDVVDRKNLIYAALFCYRQSIELFLKRLITGFGVGQTNAPNTHDLNVLWERFRIIVRHRNMREDAVFDAMQTIVFEMHEADKKSDGFRFPVGRDGLAFICGDRSVDLNNLRTIMQRVETFFECVDAEFTSQDDRSAD